MARVSGVHNAKSEACNASLGLGFAGSHYMMHSVITPPDKTHNCNTTHHTKSKAQLTSYVCNSNISNHYITIQQQQISQSDTIIVKHTRGARKHGIYTIASIGELDAKINHYYLSHTSSGHVMCDFQLRIYI